MKKTWFYAAVAAIMLISMVAGHGYAQTGEGNGEMDPDLAPEYAAPSWAIGWVDDSTSADVGAYPSVAYNPANGQAYISYYDAVNGNLMLASPSSGGWWVRVVDSTGDVGRYTSIDFWSGVQDQQNVWKLGIAYYDVTHDSLKYAVWTEYPTGGFWHIVTVQIASDLGSLGTYNTLKFDSAGVPHILYRATVLVNSYLSFAKFVGSGGNCGLGSDLNLWYCDGVDSGPGIGMYASMDIGPLNTIYIAYYDGGNSDLKYAYYTGTGTSNCGLNGNFSCRTIDSTGDVGQFASITAAGTLTDVPRIAYYDKTNGTVKFAFPNTSDPNCGGGFWWCGDVDSIGAGIIVPHGISMALDKRNAPVIAYMSAPDDQAPSVLKIARPYSAVGLNWGNCGDTLPNMIFTYWQCNVLDNASYGQGYVNLANFTAIAVSPHGQISIPYLETNDYDQVNTLKIAQTLPTFADVPWQYWAHDYIESFHFAGITNGCGGPPLIYCPERNVTRAEMAVFMLRAKNGLVTPTPAPSGMFADVPVAGKEWMKPWIEEFYNEGITTGCGSSPLIYCPERNVTRAEMAVFILRAIHAPGWTPPLAMGSSFADVPVTGKTWMMPWIEEYYNEGLTTGCGYNALHQLIYCPERNVTRAEMAVFIDRAFNIK